MKNPTDLLAHNPELVTEIQKSAGLMERLSREGYAQSARVKMDIDVMQHIYPTLELVRLCVFLGEVWQQLEVLKQEPSLKELFAANEPSSGWHLQNKQSSMMAAGVRSANSLLAGYMRSAPKKGRRP